MFKKFLFIIFTIYFFVLFYQFVGNLYRAIGGVKLIGNENAHFLGYYMIAGGYLILVIFDGIILLLLAFYKKKAKNIVS